MIAASSLISIYKTLQLVVNLIRKIFFNNLFDFLADLPVEDGHFRPQLFDLFQLQQYERFGDAIVPHFYHFPFFMFYHKICHVANFFFLLISFWPTGIFQTWDVESCDQGFPVAAFGWTPQSVAYGRWVGMAQCHISAKWVQKRFLQNVCVARAAFTTRNFLVGVSKKSDSL